MNAILNWLFGLSDMGFGAQGVEVALARPLPTWGWFLAMLVAAGLGWYSYWRQDGPRWPRIGLGVLRALALLTLLVVFTGPHLVRPNDRIEKDWVVVLADRSASMGIPDAPQGGARVTREQQLEVALQQSAGPLAAMTEHRNVLWLGFDTGAFDLPAPRGTPELGKPAGRRTAIGAAIDQALSRVAARPVSGLVLLSDGRSLDEASRAAIKRLQTDQIPVLSLALGSADPVTDLAIESVEAPAVAFVNDTIPVQVALDKLGPAPAGPARVQLVDRATGAVLDERAVRAEDWAEARARITLTTKPRREGEEVTDRTTAQTWDVKLVTDTPDLIPDNNAAEVRIDLVDRQLRVAYFDGYPRWEYRYLKNLLLRERSIRSANLLLAANRQYLQEGDVLLETLPRSSEDWAKFDVVILGDLSASVFSREQLENLREHVAVRGAGLLWIGGPAATPGSWRDTPLADLLPFTAGGAERGAAQGGLSSFTDPVVMRPTPAARRLNVLQLADDPVTPAEAWPAKLTDPATGWSLLQFAQQIDPAWLKPTAEVLAEFVPAVSPLSAEAGTPAVVTMRFGAGRVMYVATDEIWRWRYARGETLNERFWLPLVRMQGRESLSRSARSAVLEVLPRRAWTDQPASISLRLLDQALVDVAPARIRARVRPLDTGDVAASEVTLQPESASGSGRAIAKSYVGAWLPTQPGKYRVEVLDNAIASAGLSVDVDVGVPDDELRRPETDHALLERLVAAGGSGSRMITPVQLGELDRLLPRRDVHIAGTPDIRTLWDRPIVLIVLLLLLGLEWAGRRLIKLS